MRHMSNCINHNDPKNCDCGAFYKALTDTLTIRDHIAMNALNGILSCFKDHENCESVDTRVKKAYEYADEMLRQKRIDI